MVVQRTNDEARDRLGWTCVAAVTAVVLATWIPRLTGPLPGNHIGNVAARYGLHVRNLYADGLVGSSFSAAWEPYRPASYAHHPPLLNALDAIAGLWPGEAAFQLLVVPAALAASAIPAGAWLLRSLGYDWRATLLAVGAMAATGYFWIYSFVMVDLGPIFATAAGVIRLLDGGSDRRLTAGVVVTVAVAASLSWPGIAFTAVLVGWLVARRRDQTTARVAVSAAVAMAVSATFMVGVGGPGELVDQADTRSTVGSYPVWTIVRRVWEDARDLLPWWYLVLLPLALGLALADRRTRPLAGLSTLFALGWVLVLGNGAFVHDYWAYLVLVPGLLGAAALVDRTISILDRTQTPRSSRSGRASRGDGVALISGVAIAVSFAITVSGPLAERLIERPADAGRLIEALDLPAEQAKAWVVGFDFTRVVSYRTERPVDELTDVDVPGLADHELVFVDLTDLPSWYPVATMPAPIADRNGYGIVTIGALREALSDDPSTR